MLSIMKNELANCNLECSQTSYEAPLAIWMLIGQPCGRYNEMYIRLNDFLSSLGVITYLQGGANWHIPIYAKVIEILFWPNHMAEYQDFSHHNIS